MNHHNRITVIRSHVLDEIIAKSVGEFFAVKVLGSIGVYENECGVGVGVWWVWVLGVKVPAQDPSVFGDTLLECLERTYDIRGRVAAAAAAGYEGAVEG